MPVNSIKRKQFEKVKKEKARKFREQVEKFNAKPSSSFRNEEEKKDNVLDLYQRMSPSEKAAFDKELEEKN